MPEARVAKPMLSATIAEVLSTARRIVASSTTATARPIPVCLKSSAPCVAKSAYTATITLAALVTMPAWCGRRAQLVLGVPAAIGGLAHTFAETSPRPGQQKYAITVSREAAQLHDLSATDERRQGQAIGQPLAEGTQIWPDVMDVLRSPEMPAKSSFDLVEDQDDPVFVAQLPQSRREAGRRWFGGLSHQDDRRDLT
jgi:hypothetical protein